MTDEDIPGNAEKLERNWEIWRRRAVGRETFVSIARDMGIGHERVRGIYAKCQRRVQSLMRRNSFSKGIELRDHLLGVEFSFTHESLLEDYRHEIFKKEYDHSYEGKFCMAMYWVKKPEPSE